MREERKKNSAEVEVFELCISSFTCAVLRELKRVVSNVRHRNVAAKRARRLTNKQLR